MVDPPVQVEADPEPGFRDNNNIFPISNARPIGISSLARRASSIDNPFDSFMDRQPSSLEMGRRQRRPFNNEPI